MLTKTATLTLENNRLLVAGDFNFFSVAALWEQSLPLLIQCAELHFDFSAVQASNSAGLALLVEWLKWAKQHNKPISFKNIPPQLMSIAGVCGLDSILQSV